MRTGIHTNTENAHLKVAYTHASTGIIITDDKGCIVTANPYILRKFGLSKSELTGLKIELLIPGIFKEKHTDQQQQYIQQTPASLVGERFSLTARKKNGKEFPVKIGLTDYRVKGEKFVLVLVADVTEKNKTAKRIANLRGSLATIVDKRICDLQKKTTTLSLTNTKLHGAVLFQNAILENAGAIIIATDINGLIQIFNHEAEIELGYKATEVIGKTMPLLFHKREELLAKAEILSQELKTNISPDMEVFFAKARLGFHNEYEWTYRCKNGEEFPVVLNVTAIRNQNHKLIGYLGVGINILQRRQFEQELQQALEREKELSNLKSKFVSIASHEFRTPLSTISSSAYLIEKYYTVEDQPKREVHIRHIMEAVEMLTDILNDFLSVGKIEEGKIIARPSFFNLKEITEKLKEDLKLMLKPGQTINYYHKGNEEVYMDAGLMKHILMNLISNAIKFSGEDGKIKIQTVTTQRRVTLSVTDNGIGIPLDDQKHLMKRFFRGANTGNIQGTGLGLHIVSKYSELMNGKVSFASEPDKGTTFKIIFNTENI